MCKENPIIDILSHNGKEYELRSRSYLLFIKHLHTFAWLLVIQIYKIYHYERVS